MHHELDSSETVNWWDRSIDPRVTVEPGDTVTAHMRDASDGQVHPGMSHEEFAAIDSERVHGLTGPIRVEGARPGGVLEVRIQEYQLEGWGWTGIIPGAGLLDDEFEEHFLHIWEFEDGYTESLPGTRVPLDPFCGIVGVQRDRDGEFGTRPPGPWGGNMDVRHLTAGSRLFLPVHTEGAGLCVGDGHAAQGDGEVSVTGIEAPMAVTFEVRYHDERSLSGPELVTTPGLEPAEVEAESCRAFVESAETARPAARRATLRAMEYSTDRTELSREQAYVLCSVALGLTISQTVNDPMMTVTGYLPESVFTAG